MKKLISQVVLIFSLLGALNAAFAQSGSLDPTFGNGGIVETNFGPLNNFFVTNDFSFTDAALAPNGDIVVAGSVTGLDNQSETAVIVRYLPNGKLDSTFANGGILTIPAPNNFALGSSLIFSVTVDASDRIVALFEASSNTGTETNALLRFNQNGQPDATFGNNGQVTVAFPEQLPLLPGPKLVFVQPDGKILVAGEATPPFRSTVPAETLLARYLSNGTSDTTFGHNGFVEEVAIGTPSAVALLSEDNILVLDNGGRIAEFTATGALAPTVTGGAVAATKSSGTVAFQRNEEYLLAGTTGGPSGRRNIDANISRFLVDDAVDASFSSPAISFGPTGPLVKSVPAAIALDSLGRAIIGGIFATPNNGVFGLARVGPTGSLDTTFGNAGVVTTQVALEGSVFAVLVQPDNKIVAIGEVQVSKSIPGTTEGLGIARYLAQ